MINVNRRRLLQGSTALAATTMIDRMPLLEIARAWAQEMPFQPEEGAQLRMLRWSEFVESEAEAFNALLDAFSQATGVPVEVDKEFLENLRPKAAVAANVGDGPDIIWGLHADAHLYPRAMLDITDIAEYLGQKYGPWYDVAKYYGMRDGRWITLPFTITGDLITYRKSMVQKAGFEDMPDNTDDFLEAAKALKENGTPIGFALGHSSNDGNAWVHWLLWTFGGKLVDEDNNVVINSPETIAALEYGRELYPTFIPGVGSWLDGHNNKAYLGGDISVTNNALSIYAAAKADEAMNEIAEDTFHAAYPIGPVGERMELHVMRPFMLYDYTPYPNAAKALVTWLSEAEQFNRLTKAAVGYFSPTLPAFRDNPVWKADPKRLPFRDVAKFTLPFSYAGELGYAAAAVFADFIVLDMVAQASAGNKTPKDAAALAETRARRYYDV